MFDPVYRFKVVFLGEDCRDALGQVVLGVNVFEEVSVSVARLQSVKVFVYDPWGAVRRSVTFVV